MKKLLLLPLFLLSGFVFAEDTAYQPIGPFGGINSTDNPLIIQTEKAQDLLNVDITPGGKSVKKREGYSQLYQMTRSSSAAHGTHYFYDSSGNGVALYFNDVYAYSSTNGGLLSTIYSTGPVNATYQCVDSQGFAYCTNTSRTGILKTSGNGITFVTPISTGTMLAVTPTRLVMAGFSDYPNRIDFSQANDFTNWTPGGLSYSPVNFTVVSPGSRITHIVYAHERVYWFKNTSFGYILDGPTLADWSLRTISNDIGTNDNTSVYHDGILYFRGSDSNIYAYDGSSLINLTRELKATMSVSQSRAENSWSQTSASDFGAGAYLVSNTIDTTTVSGQVQLYLNTDFIPSQCASAPSTYDDLSYVIPSARTFTTTSDYIITKIAFYLSTDFTSGASGYVSYTLVANNTGNPWTGTTLGATASTPVTLSYYSPSYVTLDLISPVSISSGTRYWLRIDGSMNGGAKYRAWTPSPTCDASEQYNLKDTGTKVTGRWLYKIYASSYSTTGTWQSNVKYSPDLTTWDNFRTTKDDANGSHTFYIRAATGAFTVSSSTPSWTLINSGNVPTASTGTYFQIRDVIATSSATTTPVLYDFMQTWIEGGASDKSYATYFDDAIWWSIASGAGATTNNTILRYDLVNPNTWTLYDIDTNGMLVRNKTLYFVGSSTGVIYRFGGTDNDNGAAINAYWKSKDFIGVSPFVDNEYTNLSLSAAMVENSSMTVTYTINGSSSTSYSMPLKIGNSTFTKFNKNLPVGRVGTYFNLQFGNNAADQPFEVFGAQYGFRPKPWNVTY